MDKLAELLAAIAAKQAEARALLNKPEAEFTTDDLTKATSLETEIKDLRAKAELVKKFQEDFAASVGGTTVNTPAAKPAPAAQAAAAADALRAAANDAPPSAVLPNVEDRSGNGKPHIDPRAREEKVYQDITQQLNDIRTVTIPGSSFDDKEGAYNRLTAVKEARIAKGNTLTDDEGGWAVQTDIATEIQKLSFAKAPLAQRCKPLSLSNGAKSIRLPYLKDKDRTARMVTVYWAQEGGTVSKSDNVKVGDQMIEMKKIMAFWDGTDEVMRHAGVVANLTLDAIANEMAFVLEEAILRGNGTTQPLGIFNSNCLITVAKETNQAADSFVFENLVNMNARAYGDNGVVFLNKSVEAKLPYLKLDVGLGGSAIYMPTNGAEDGPKVGRLYGMPMVRSEHMSAVGDVGDIGIFDLSQYGLLRGASRFDSSIHVAFMNDTNTFRFIDYVGGAPLWNGVYTPYKGSETEAPFVILAARA